MVKTTLDLPESMHDALQVLAKRTGRSQADMIREALGAYLAQQEEQRVLPRSVGAVCVPEVQAADAEEWLAEHWRPT
ncbi:MAG: ribbon-helix-helix protein, CopG family [Thermomicrobiales bacterium]|jgi:predicted DNA-binding protein